MRTSKRWNCSAVSPNNEVNCPVLLIRVYINSRGGVLIYIEADLHRGVASLKVRHVELRNTPCRKPSEPERRDCTVQSTRPGVHRKRQHQSQQLYARGGGWHWARVALLWLRSAPWNMSGCPSSISRQGPAQLWYIRHGPSGCVCRWT